MPVVNPLARELVFKLVYYGPGLGGKTTSLQYVHAHTKPEHRGKMVSLATPVDRTLYFDFLPVRLPNVRGMNVRLQLFTVPGQVYYNATRKLVLTGADGVVLVIDSQRLRLDANLESLENLRENLREHGRSLGEVPHVIQYNKRDLPDVLSVDELDQKVNRHGVSWFSTIAPRGDGVFEALSAITESVLADFQRRMPEREGTSSPTLELPEGGIAEALRAAENGPAPSEPPARFVNNEAATTPSGSFRLSTLPDADPGEAAARAVTDQPRVDGGGERIRSSTLPSLPSTELASAARAAPPEPRMASAATRPAASRPAAPAPAAVTSSGPSFAPLFPAPERPLVHELEAALGASDFSHAVLAAEQLVARSFASAAKVLGNTADAPRDPAVVCLLLGLEGRRYLDFRALVRDVRAGRHAVEIEALVAYAFAIDARIARSRVSH